MRAAAGAVYSDGPPGWFASTQAAPLLETWLARLADACSRGRYARALTATHALMHRAQSRSAVLLERHTFLERVGQVTVRELLAAGERAEAVAARRLILSLQQALLCETEDDARLIRVPETGWRISDPLRVMLSMSVTDELLKHNEAYAASFDKGELPLPPGKKLAVLACMDARLDVAAVLGLEPGDAHVIRNAGGVVTDDEVRSLAISQRLLGTEEWQPHRRHRLRHAHVPRRRVQALDPGRHGHQARSGRPRPSETSTRTSASRSRASRRAGSSRTRTRSAASSTRSRRAGCAKCPKRSA